MPSFAVKRLYETPAEEDGVRILIDGLWPRGVRRDDWPGSSWRPQLAPSRELREWFGHRPEKFPEFRRRYRAELAENPDIRGLLTFGSRITLVTAKRDVEHSHAAVLRAFLEERSTDD